MSANLSASLLRDPAPAAATAMSDRRARLQQALEAGARLLPVQAPLEVFVHLNLLTAFQHLPFHEAIAEAQTKLRCRGYLPEERYREALGRGRILAEDLDAVIADEQLPGEPLVPGFPSPAAATRLVLRHGVGSTSLAHLRWNMVEKDAANRFGADVPPDARAAIVRETTTWLEGQLVAAGPGGARSVAAQIVSPTPGVRSTDPLEKLGALLGRHIDEGDLRGAFESDPELVSVRALWTACVRACEHLEGAPVAAPAPGRFFRHNLLATTGEDPAELVHELLIPLCAVFLDRGLSHWTMPDRDLGFFRAWANLMSSGRGIRPAWLASLDQRLRRWRAADADAEAVILELLAELGIEDDELDAFLEHTLLQLPGYAGMFERLSSAPGPRGRSPALVRLVDFVAVRLALDVLAYRHVAARLGHVGPAAEIRAACARAARIAEPRVHGRNDTAWPLFRLCQLAGVSSARVRSLRPDDVDAVLGLLARLDENTRLRLLHEAYERRYVVELLSAITANVRTPPVKPAGRPRFQALFCLDDRFESSRRHIEEIAPNCETFGAAGFFGLAIAYQGIDDPSTFPLCPVVVQPQHRIEEQALTRQFDVAELRAQRRRQLGRVEDAFSRASRSLVLGPLVTAVSGFAAALPLLANVFAPRAAHQVRSAVARWWLPEPLTRLTALRAEESPSSTDALMLGFTVDELAARVAAFIENTGILQFAPFVLVLGHDASSVNNPLFPAYSCAACGGRSGGPNARLFARMANHPGVREKLRERGIDIPDDTVFVGAMYDSCTEAIQFYDVDHVPADARGELAAIGELLREMGRRDAHERCRKFEGMPPRLTPERALQICEARAVDLSQPRFELGHASNAASLFGRRARTRGLFLDRRILLVSYDPTIDPEGKIIERQLVNAGPVGAGINLDYYCSSVDPERLGSGSKLPHNVTGLFGVMNGSGSDLRTGLPTQATELHEPMRLQLIVEAKPELLVKIAERHAVVGELVKNEWVRLISLDPDSDRMLRFDRRFGFRPFEPSELALPRVPSSRDWYDGRGGFIPPALIRPPAT